MVFERSGDLHLYQLSRASKGWYFEGSPVSALLELVRKSAETGDPIPWVQIHKVPDYVFFNHSVHVNRGVSCVECHGRVDEMEEVYQAKSLSMSFCLDCHRNPEMKVRPLDKITDLDWEPSPDTQKDWGK